MSKAALADPPLTRSRTFPATADQAREARRFVAAVLGDHPLAGDVTTCVSELAANAIQPSRSALPGGTFLVRASCSAVAVRVEVTDQGGPWNRAPDDSEHGRSLLIVRALASRCGMAIRGPDRDPSERTIWFEIRISQADAAVARRGSPCLAPGSGITIHMYRPARPTRSCRPVRSQTPAARLIARIPARRSSFITKDLRWSPAG